MAITNAHLDDHLKRKLGTAGFSVSGATVTVPGSTMTASDLRELIRVSDVTRHEVSLVAGVLTIKPV